MHLYYSMWLHPENFGGGSQKRMEEWCGGQLFHYTANITSHYNICWTSYKMLTVSSREDSRQPNDHRLGIEQVNLQVRSIKLRLANSRYRKEESYKHLCYPRQYIIGGRDGAGVGDNCGQSTRDTPSNYLCHISYA